MKRITIKNLIKVTIGTAIFFAAVLIVNAQGISPRGEATAKITFPVAELGNCGSKEECKAYCNITENIPACTAFAEKNGLIKKEDKDKADQFSKQIKTNGGPGGCTDNKSCQAYCSDQSHQQECLDFAEKHGFIKKEDKQKVEKFAQEMKNGTTPGGCQSKDACETYCHDQSHQEECLNFIVKVGGITQEEADKIKQNKGQPGPGGCSSKESCEAFCNKEENHETCLNFAKEHGFIKQGDVQNIQEGVSRVRTGIENAPQEVKDCLSQSVALSTLSQIENGTFTPTAEVGKTVKDCFEKFRPQIQENIKHQFNTSPEVEACIKTAVGADVLQGLKDGKNAPDETAAVKMRSCFDAQGHRDEQQGQQMDSAGQDSQNNPSSQNVNKMSECIGKKLGPDAQKQILDRTLDTSSAEVKAAMESCSREFSNAHNTGESGQHQPMPNNPPPAAAGSNIKDCLQERLGAEGFQKFVNASPSDRQQFAGIMEQCGYKMNLPTQSSSANPSNQTQTQPLPTPAPEFKPTMGPNGQPPAGQQGQFHPELQPGQPQNTQPPPPQVKGASTTRSKWSIFWDWVLGR